MYRRVAKLSSPIVFRLPGCDIPSAVLSTAPSPAHALQGAAGANVAQKWLCGGGLKANAAKSTPVSGKTVGRQKLLQEAICEKTAKGVLEVAISGRTAQGERC